MRASAGTLIPVMFWGGLLGIRALAPVIFCFTSPRKAAQVGLALACVGMIGLIVFTSPLGIALALAATGAGMATVFPTTLSMLTELAGARTDRVAPPMFVLSNLGAASMAWLVGFLIDRTGSPSLPLMVPLLALMLILAAHLSAIPRAYRS